MPPYVYFIGGTSGGNATYDAATNNLQITDYTASIAAGATKDYSFDVRVISNVSQVDTISNLATVNGTGTRPSDPINPNQPDPRCIDPNGCSTDIPIDKQAPNLSAWKIVKDSNGDGKAQPNEDLTYEIHVKNIGNVLIANLSITDPVPQHTTYISGGIISNGTVSFTDVNLAVNETRIYTFVAKVNNNLTGVVEITNIATVNGDGKEVPAACDVTQPNCTANIPTDPTKVDLSIVKKSETKAAAPGTPYNYTITIKNLGASVASGVKIVDSLSSNLNYISAVSTEGQLSFDASTNVLSLDIPTVNPQQEITITLTVSAKTVGTVVNVATISSNEEDTDNSNNRSVDSKDITDFFIPNVFTPNGDNNNDKFVIRGLENYPGSPLAIYNRWGNQVYFSTDYKNDWDGSQLPEGVYYYLLRVRMSDNTMKKYSGYVEVIKNLTK